jgi:hypothetical protein
MRMSPAPAPVKLALTEDALEAAVAAPWIGPLVALGGHASCYTSKLEEDRQLVVVLSVPQRDFAAALIGSGWVMNSAAPELPEPIEALRELKRGTAVRVVTCNSVIADRLIAIDETKKPPRIRLSGSQWLATGIHAAAALDQELDKPIRMPRPSPGTVARIARLDQAWDARLAAPQADLAIIGTLKWLSEDLAAYLTREGETIVPDLLLTEFRKTGAAERVHEIGRLGGTLADLLLPAGKQCATWFTRLYASARLFDHLPLPNGIRAAILDGAGAIRYVAEVEAPVVICILDRSIADETAAEMVVQLRNSRGEPISLKGDLGWRPSAGIEALAFTVPL